MLQVNKRIHVIWRKKLINGGKGLEVSFQMHASYLGHTWMCSVMGGDDNDEKLNQMNYKLNLYVKPYRIFN